MSGSRIPTTLLPSSRPPPSTSTISAASGTRRVSARNGERRRSSTTRRTLDGPGFRASSSTCFPIAGMTPIFSTGSPCTKVPISRRFATIPRSSRGMTSGCTSTWLQTVDSARPLLRPVPSAPTSLPFARSLARHRLSARGRLPLDDRVSGDHDGSDVLGERGGELHAPVQRRRRPVFRDQRILHFRRGGQCTAPERQRRGLLRAPVPPDLPALLDCRCVLDRSVLPRRLSLVPPSAV